jgi:hypothetical protein
LSSNKIRLTVVGAWLLTAAAGRWPAAAATESLYRLAEPAAWIEVAAPEFSAPDPVGGVSNGAWCVLIDRQINVNAAGEDAYQHLAMKALTAQGVEDQSSINIKVDPTYQTLDIHSIQVVRDGRAVDQRKTARITVLPVETEIQNRIYDGGYNINILLSDVRAGDVIDYSYTVHSRENLFPGHFSGTWRIGFSNPVRRERLRIRSPLERELRYRLSNSARPPVPRIQGNVREVELEWRDLAATIADDDRPSWYFTWPYLEVSDLNDWSAVAKLVTPLFFDGHPASPALAGIAAEIRAGGGSAEERALRALQYVQEQVRYVSIAIGPAAYRPADPGTVLARRFGDCKDKSLLLATLLRQLGVEAQPALVHSRRGKMLTGALPTPYAFDHAIVRAQIGNKVFWLDPTAGKRYAPLSTDSPADFENALIVDAATTDLASIPRPTTAVRSKSTSVVFDLSGGVDHPAKLDIVISYMGILADEIRRTIARRSPEQRQSNYVNYIARYYPGAKTAAPITVDDDEARNIVEIREHYTLERTFVKEPAGDLAFFLHADEIYDYVSPLDSSVRQAPLAIEYPIWVRQNIRAILPDQWPIKGDSVMVENPAFMYRSTVIYSAAGHFPELELDYSYEALADHVDVAALEQYQADRKRVYDDLGFNLHRDGEGDASSGKFAISPLPTAALLLSLALSAWAAVRWGRRYDPPPRPAAHDAPKGIAGWLVLPALGVIAGPFFSAWIFTSVAQFVSADMWDALPAIVAHPIRAWAQPVMLVIYGFTSLVLVVQVLTAVLFFKKRSSAPAAFIAVSWLSFLYGLTLMAAVMQSGLDAGTTPLTLVAEAVRGTLGTALWTAYMLKSQRVKATFVSRAPATAFAQAAGSSA